MNPLVISVVVLIILILLVMTRDFTAEKASKNKSNLTFVATGATGEDDDKDVSCVTELNALKKILKAKNLERKKTCSEQVLLIKEKIQKSQNQIDILKNHRRADADPAI